MQQRVRQHLPDLSPDQTQTEEEPEQGPVPFAEEVNFNADAEQEDPLDGTTRSKATDLGKASSFAQTTPTGSERSDAS